MKRILFSCLSVLLCCATLLAVPAQRVRKTVRLADGTPLAVTLVGDEHFSWLVADDGTLVEPLDAEGDVYVRTSLTLAAESRRALAARRAPKRVGSQATAPLPAFGTVRVPVVLVNFADSVFTVGETDEEIRAYYDLFCNGTRDGELYKGHGSYGSVRDYFMQQSGGLFQPEFTIIGPVTLPNPESAYGKNDSTSTSKDTGYSSFRKDAITAATAIYEGDWMDFDNQGKGQVDLIFYVYAGCGENSGADATTLWPKESTASTTVNGIKFATTGCTSESSLVFVEKDKVMVPSSSRPDGIGVFCHEVSHALGLPDFYDTSYQAFGMDLWSLMDYGCYANNGYQPGGYNAYERDFMGWRALETLTEPCDLVLQPMEAGGIGYKIVNDENPDEYYIIENRQSVGWDETLGRMGHGLLVTHVDYDASAWRNNRVNTRVDHQRMTIIAANDRYVGTTISRDFAEWRKTWEGNLYPYKKTAWEYNDSLTANSVPAATVYTKSGFMYKNLNAIKEQEDGSVTLHFGNDYDVVGIRPLSADERRRTQDVYDLTGRRLTGREASLAPGIYVVGGRKRAVR